MVDVIVIGSGAGGLTAAVALARAGREVLVLEQHYLPGGWCHSFSLGGYTYSPGVHYVGQLGPDGGLRRIYEGLGVANDLTFFELAPDGIDRVSTPSGEFRIPRGRQRLEERLVERFPREERAIRAYLHRIDALRREIEELAAGGVLGARSAISLPLKARNTLRFGLRPLAALWDHVGLDDPFLRTILGAQCGDHGLPPSRVPASLHAAVVGHYFDGGWYPQGGARSIPRAFIRALKRRGGRLEVRTRVAQILIEGGPRSPRAVGVRLADGTEIRARHVVSNADAAVTYGRLVPAEHQGRRLRRKVRRLRPSTACLSLFGATDLDLEAAGMDSGNVWRFGSDDLEAAYQSTRARAPSQLGLDTFFLTATTLKDRTKRPKGHHTFEAFVLTSAEPFREWSESSHEDRPAAYLDLKQRLEEQMLQQLDTVVPGLSQRVVFSELGTPLTNDFYCEAPSGAMYGPEKSARQVGPFAFPIATHIEGLTLCGASTTSHGVMGATLSGLAAAGKVAGVRPDALLNASGQSLSCYLADDMSDWPDALVTKADRAAGERVA